jgi:hypothetical protein
LRLAKGLELLLGRAPPCVEREKLRQVELYAATGKPRPDRIRILPDKP